MVELLVLIPFLLLGVIGSVAERRLWNGGVCKETGERWEYFDTDSQGGRGYRSKDKVAWISWSHDG